MTNVMLTCSEKNKVVRFISSAYAFRENMMFFSVTGNSSTLGSFDYLKVNFGIFIKDEHDKVFSLQI